MTNENINYLAILDKRYSEYRWSINGFTYDDIEWFSDTPKPTKEEMDALHDEVMSELQQEWNAVVDDKDDLISRLSNAGISLEEIEKVFGVKINL